MMTAAQEGGPIRCVCGRRVQSPSPEWPWLCSRCRQTAESRAARRWSDLGFRDAVRSLIGQRVIVSFSTQRPGQHGGGFAHARGKLRGCGNKYLLVGNIKVRVKSITGAWIDYQSGEWRCACGCRERVKLKYRPSHGPPFWKPGHWTRVRKVPITSKRGPAWNRGLTGEDWKHHFTASAWEKVAEGRTKGVALVKERARHEYRTREGYIMVRVEGRFPSGAPKVVPRGRMVMERVLGRPLLRNEMVVHLNARMDDDRPENLVVLPISDRSALAHAISTGRRGKDLLAYVTAARGATQNREWKNAQARTRYGARRRLAPVTLAGGPVR